jgi:hypothetical protein
MKTTEIDYFYTIHPGNKNGVKMRSCWYNEIKKYMLELLESQGEIPFMVFVQLVHTKFAGDLGENTGWHLYQVKLDLEARGILKHRRPQRGKIGSSVVSKVSGKNINRRRMSFSYVG